MSEKIVLNFIISLLPPNPPLQFAYKPKRNIGDSIAVLTYMRFVIIAKIKTPIPEFYNYTIVQLLIQ